MMSSKPLFPCSSKFYCFVFFPCILTSYFPTFYLIQECCYPSQFCSSWMSPIDMLLSWLSLPKRRYYLVTWKFDKLFSTTGNLLLKYVIGKRDDNGCIYVSIFGPPYKKFELKKNIFNWKFCIGGSKIIHWHVY